MSNRIMFVRNDRRLGNTREPDALSGAYDVVELSDVTRAGYCRPAAHGNGHPPGRIATTGFGEQA